MTGTDDIPEPDRIDGAPHPRETPELFAQQEAEATFLDAVRADRLHHAWLITGPRGIGKATLAWRLARFLLATEPAGGDGLFGAPPPPDTLDVPPDHPVVRRMRALSEPRLFLLRRPWDERAKRLRQEITVDEARRLKSFFALSSTDGGRRVAIVDSADELNMAAANAVLKLLEEPPAQTVFLMVSHQPSRLLPTIRSRCRTLRCRPLAPGPLSAALAGAGADPAEGQAALSALAEGSVGAALRLIEGDGLTLYADIVSLMRNAPALDRPAAIAFCERVAGRGSDLGIERALEMIALFLARLARTGIFGPPTPEAAPGEAALLSRLCPNAAAARHWAGILQEVEARTRHGVAVNLDPAALLLDTVLRLTAGAGTVQPAPA